MTIENDLQKLKDHYLHMANTNIDFGKNDYTAIQMQHMIDSFKHAMAQRQHERLRSRHMNDRFQDQYVTALLIEAQILTSEHIRNKIPLSIRQVSDAVQFYYDRWNFETGTDQDQHAFRTLEKFYYDLEQHNVDEITYERNSNLSGMDPRTYY